MPYLTYDEEYIDDLYKDAEGLSDEQLEERVRQEIREWEQFRKTQVRNERTETQRNRRANDHLSAVLEDIGRGLDTRSWFD